MTALAPTLQRSSLSGWPGSAGQPANHDRLPRHLPAAAALPPAAHRQSPLSPGLGRSQRQTISAFLDHLEDSAVTPPAAATPGWPRSTRCSATPRCAIPSTPSSSSRSWPSRKNASTARRSRSSPPPKPTRC